MRSTVKLSPLILGKRLAVECLQLNCSADAMHKWDTVSAVSGVSVSGVGIESTFPL